MKINVNAYGGNPIESDSILGALASERIVAFKKCEDGQFRVRECCDSYFGGLLTKNQMIALGNEIIELANK